MSITIFMIGAITGIFFNEIIFKFSYNILNQEKARFNLIVPLITGVIFLADFFKYGLKIMFFKFAILSSILLVISIIDIRHKVIPNKIVLFTLIIGIIFSFVGDISFYNSILGMLLGGGLLFLLALIPNAMGGGDVKLMFAIGSFLGYTKTLWALILAFILASLVSLILLVFKIKHRKDYIPFGPFIAIGTFISFLFLK